MEEELGITQKNILNRGLAEEKEVRLTRPPSLEILWEILAKM